MSKHIIEQFITSAIHTLQQQGQLTVALPRIQIDSTKDKAHGDFATNVALVLAKPARQKPHDIAEMIVKALPASTQIKKVEIAGPGFINFFLASNVLHRNVNDILSEGERYGHTDIGKHQRILVEFVSSNPTGPLHVGHGRHAAFGAVVCNLLSAIGCQVHREYYINDAGRQMDILAVSVWIRYLTLCGESFPFPTNAYQGDYVVAMAHSLVREQGNTLVVPATFISTELPPDEPEGGDKERYIDAVIAKAKTLLSEAQYDTIFDASLTSVLNDIRDDLAEFGVTFDEWFSERAFVKTDAVARTIQILKEKHFTYEKEGALWFNSTQFGDDKDRVLLRANGAATYFVNDLAYHVRKLTRDFDTAIDIFGSDHHGYIPRLNAGLQACGIHANKLCCHLLQFVMLYRGGQPVSMSTRSGSFVTLRELREEVGNDAARFFYVMRRAEQRIDFDLDLAKSHTNDNPVFYIQYAHARICSVFRQLAEKNLTYDASQGLAHLALLTEPHEAQMLSILGRYRDIIKDAALQHEPPILTNYLRELANDFHSYYNSHPFLVDDLHLRCARLALISATRQVLANGLTLIGVSTPESM